MNKLFIIGNLTRDPESGTTPSGVNYCNFTVAVNGRGDDDAIFMRVTAWRALGDTCSKYLAKGRKVAVVGAVSASAYQGNDGQPRASLEINADSVEFLSARGNGDGYQ